MANGTLLLRLIIIPRACYLAYIGLRLIARIHKDGKKKASRKRREIEVITLSKNQKHIVTK